MTLSGHSLREEHINNSKKLLKATFEDDASFILGVYVWELGKKTIDDYVNDQQVKIRMFGRSFSNANGAIIKFQTPIDYELVVGDIVYDSNRNDHLIVTEVYNLDDIHWQGKLTLCNWILKWQNKQTGEILEYPCYDINSTQYNSGEQSNRQFTIGSSQHMITLPCDENTVMLSTPQRFFLDKNIVSPTSFIVTQNDNTSYSYGKKGLVKLTVYEYPTNKDSDRPDLGICDYFEKNDIGKEDAVGKSLIEYDTNIIKSGGDAKKFIAKFFDNSGNEIPNITPVWDIVCDFKNKLEVSQSDNDIYISIDDDAYIDEEFKLVLSDVNRSRSSSIVVRIDSLF